MNNNRTKCMIALSNVVSVGPVAAKKLIDFCEGVEEIFSASKKELSGIPNIGPTTINALQDESIWEKAENQILYNAKHSINTYTYKDKEYPKRLRNISSSPIVLYHNGKGNLNHNRTIGIVGTRNPTPRGIAIVENLIAGLADYDVQVISGLAYGIDAQAHKSSLKNNLATIGVLGHGHDKMYPAEHRSLATKMTRNGGTITEFQIETKFVKENFPRRNRIIAALCDALIVVESANKGGSIITAQYANEYDRDVFAVPGRIDDKLSQGCNNLIKTNKAHLLQSATDIGYILGWNQSKENQKVNNNILKTLDNTEKKIIEYLLENPKMNIDELNQKMQLNTSELASKMISLEFKGVIKSIPGKKFIVFN